MRPGLACAALLLAAFVPAGVVMAQHHGGHAPIVTGPMHYSGVVAAAHPGMLGAGSYGSRGAAGPIVNQTTVNNSFGYSPSYYSGSGNFGGYGYGGYGYGGSGYYRGLSPYGYSYYGSAYGALYGFTPGAIVVPAGALFGPQPIQQMMGGGAMPAMNAGPLNVQAPPRERKVRVSNAEAKARAGKLIDQGDKLFANQRYLEALDRYKSAVIQAPDMAEIFLRQGFTFIAIGQYEPAGKAMRRGLKLQSVWKPDDLRLDRLYGPEKVAKTAHLEALAVALQAARHDATALYLTGMELFFDGQVERSGPFFVRASQLGANDDHLLDSFLSAAAAAAAAGQGGGAGQGAPAGAAPAAGPMPGAGAPGANPPDRGPILDL